MFLLPKHKLMGEFEHSPRSQMETTVVQQHLSSQTLFSNEQKIRKTLSSIHEEHFERPDHHAGFFAQMCGCYRDAGRASDVESGRCLLQRGKRLLYVTTEHL